MTKSVQKRTISWLVAVVLIAAIYHRETRSVFVDANSIDNRSLPFLRSSKVRFLSTRHISGSKRNGSTKKSSQTKKTTQPNGIEAQVAKIGYDDLGPIGKTIAGAVEVGIVTASSYLSGGILGYIIGGAMGSPILFRRLPPSFSDVPGGFQEVALKFKLLNEKAFHSANDWGQLSAAFSGFHALCRVARGGKEDKWNNIIGSGAAGAFRSRSSKCSKLCFL